MLMSSIKTAIFLPPAGPYVFPCRFSTDPSMASWKMLGVVRLLNVMLLLVCVSGFSLPMYWATMVVFAVPGPPTSRVAAPTLAHMVSRCS